MKSDLIAKTFAREEEADRALSALEMMRDSDILGLENVIVATKDRAGKAIVHQRWESLSQPGRRIPRLLADALLSDSSEDIQRLAEAGVDTLFLKDVSEALGPGNSALLIYILHESVVDTGRLLDTLALFRGEVYHTTFPAKIEEAILEVTKP